MSERHLYKAYKTLKKGYGHIHFNLIESLAIDQNTQSVYPEHSTLTLCSRLINTIHKVSIAKQDKMTHTMAKYLLKITQRVNKLQREYRSYLKHFQL
jgi:hypothetical protein